MITYNVCVKYYSLFGPLLFVVVLNERYIREIYESDIKTHVSCILYVYIENYAYRITLILLTVVAFNKRYYIFIDINKY